MSKYDFIADIVRRIPARRPIASSDPFGFIDNGTWRTVPNHLSGSGPVTHFDLLYQYATPAERKRLDALIQEQFDTGIDPTDTLRELGIHRFSASYTPQTGQVYFNIGVRDGEKLTPENKAAVMAEARLHPNISMATDTGDRFNARPGNLEWFNKNFLLPISSALALNKAAKDRGFAQNAAIDAATVFPFLIPQVAAAVLGGMAAIPTGKPDLFQKRGGSILSNMASDEALKGIRVMEGVRDAYEAIMAAPPQTRKAMLDHLTRIAPKTWVNQVKQMFHDAPVSTSLAAIPILPGKTPVSLKNAVTGLKERIASPTQYWMRKALEMTPEEFTTYASRSMSPSPADPLVHSRLELTPHGETFSIVGELLEGNPAVRKHFEDVANVPVVKDFENQAAAYNSTYSKGDPTWGPGEQFIEMGDNQALNHPPVAFNSQSARRSAPDYTIDAPAEIGKTAPVRPQEVLKRYPGGWLKSVIHETTHLQAAKRGHRLTAGPVDDYYRDIYDKEARLLDVPDDVTYRLIPSEWKADEAAQNVGHYIRYPEEVLQMTPLEFYNWVQQQRPNIGFSNKPTPTVVAQRKQRRQELRGAGIIK